MSHDTLDHWPIVNFAKSELSAETLRGLRRPLWKEQTFASHAGRYLIEVVDQPGRWLPDHRLDALHRELVQVAEQSMDEVPTYGLFTGARAAYENRVIALVKDSISARPVGFTAMVYLPIDLEGRREVVIHLGLTMIARSHRGERLQTPLFRRCFLLPVVNQRRTRFVVTNIAASPAGIGATSDYFANVYPSYHGATERTDFHVNVAEQVLRYHRHEFGCSASARLDPDTFVVHGSNDPQGGGAHQFIREDPTSRYRVDECNIYCRGLLDFAAGDELFQVGEASLWGGLWASRAARRRAAALARHPVVHATPVTR